MLKKFRNNEEGAVTVDWVVLTAAVVVLAIGLVTALRGTLSDVVCDIGARVQQQSETAEC